MAKRNVEYIIQLKDRFSKRMDRLNSKAFQLDNRMKQLDKSSTGLGSTLGKVFAGVAILVGIKKSINAFEEQEFAIAQVRQGIESTGRAAGKTLSELTAGAKKLQGETIFGDETILQNVTAQILTFTNVTEKIFDRTQQAVLDVTTRLFGARATAETLRSTAIQLGKALNDPIRNLGALSRSGITFSQSQIDVIKSLAEGGKLAEAQAIILGELERQYGGSAKAARETAFGGLAVLRSEFQDLLVIIGEQFIPVILSTKDGLKGLINFLTNNQKAIATLVKLTIVATTAFVAFKVITFVLAKGLRLYVTITKLATVATRLFTKGTKAAASSARLLGIAIKTTPIGLIASLIAGAAALFVGFSQDVEASTNRLTEFGNKINEIDAKIGLKLIRRFIETGKEAIPALLAKIEGIEDVFEPFREATKRFRRSELESLKLFLEEETEILNRSIANAQSRLKRIGFEDQLERVKTSLEIVNKEFAKFTKGRPIGGITTTTQQVGITKITSAAPKTFIINIEKLVETINNNVTNLKEGMNESKKIVVEALLDALNDTQALVR